MEELFRAIKGEKTLGDTVRYMGVTLQVVGKETRAEAIAGGKLIDVTNTAFQAAGWSTSTVIGVGVFKFCQGAAEVFRAKNPTNSQFVCPKTMLQQVIQMLDAVMHQWPDRQSFDIPVNLDGCRGHIVMVLGFGPHNEPEVTITIAGEW